MAASPTGAARGRGLRAFYGDLHNHCGISYGHGSLEDAYRNARLQLDFASVTGHAHWPDMPPREGRLAYLVDYHQRGFDRLASIWDAVQEGTEAFHEPGRFVTFLSFEWHSLRHGDYCIYYPGSRGEIVRAPDIGAMRAALARVRESGGDAMMIPHHICYVPGYRGIHWPDFDPAFSPLVEIVSMHGASESNDAPRTQLHSMGPRDGRSTAWAGLSAGHRFGVVGSTDHHSAHPGSFGHGCLGVWAERLEREALWRALRERRTWALTGERIELDVSLNGAPMGAELPFARERALRAAVRGGGALDYVELVRNGLPVARRDAVGAAPGAGPAFRGKVALAVGWGEAKGDTPWRVRLGVEGGRLLGVEPRFRGDEVVAPREEPGAGHHFSSWAREGERAVSFRTRTFPNPNPTTDATQGMALEIEGDGETRVVAELNGHAVSVPLAELQRGPRAGFLEGFVSEAWQLSRAVPEAEYAWDCAFEELAAEAPPASGDAYLVRVRQKNDQWAWASPIFVDAPAR